MVDTAKQIIAERGEPTQNTFIQNAIDPILYEELRKYGLLMDFDPSNVKQILNSHIGDEFELVEVGIAERNGNPVLGKGWWFADPSKHRLNIPLNKRVDEAITNLLRRERVVDFDDVLTEIYTKFENSLTPEQQTIKDILEENATKESSGMWRVKPFVDEITQKHEQMVFYLAKLGEKAGYKVDIADDEYGKPYQGNRLDAILNLDSYEPDNLNLNKLNRINLIDVIWHDKKDIVAEFEVEHSTSIVDAIIRGSNIEGSPKRLIVIPEQRENLVHRKFNEPAMSDLTESEEWNIILYRSLEKFFTQTKNQQEIDVGEFWNLTRQPLSDVEKESKKQNSLNDYS